MSDPLHFDNTRNTLALRPKEAAKALGIGQRKLWDLTKQNRIPHLKIDRIVMYPVDGLKAWLAANAKGDPGVKP